MSGARPLTFVSTLPPEEVARANFYGLLARLFYGPPDAALLETLAGASDIDAEDGGISEAWQRLCRAAGETDPDTVREEYDTVFVGTGKAPVTLYMCAYSIRYAREAPLVELRAEHERHDERDEPRDRAREHRLAGIGPRRRRVGAPLRLAQPEPHAAQSIRSST